MKSKSNESKDKKYGKNKKPYFKGRNRNSDRRERLDDRETGKVDRPTNNPEWYVDGPLSSAAATLFFTKPFGSKIQLWDDLVWQDITSNTQAKYSAMGIMALRVVPKMGPMAGNTDVSPLNLTSQTIYSFIRHANSGSKVYDAPDMMMYLLALADCYSVVGWMQRLYATINRYYPENKFFAKAVVSAMGANYDSFAGNMAQFRFFINTIVAKLSAFAIPGNMNFFNRRASMYTNIYLEGESIKDQLYLFYPDGFYKYQIDDSYDEAYLKYYQFTDTQVTFAGLQQYVNDMVQRLLEVEDVGIMSGDVLKAYGSNIIKLTYLPENVMIDPVVHDYNVLYQIRNASFSSLIPTPDVHQDADKKFIEWDDTISSINKSSIAVMCKSLPLTSNNMHPDVAEVMESTRLMFTSSTYESDGNRWVADLICGTEALKSITMYYFSPSSSGVLGSIVSSQNAVNDVQHLCELSQFKYHPTIYGFTGSLSGGSATHNGLFQDLDNVCEVTPEVLTNLHQTAIMNMLLVPSIALLK